MSVVAEAQTTADLQVFGQESVTHVAVDARQVSADAVVLAIGRRPDPELALHGLCAIGYAESSLSQVPRRTETLMTSITGVYAVGDCAGLCSLEEAFAEGRVAGYAASGSARLNDALASLAATRSARRAAELQSLLLDETRRTLGGGNGA
ncbi:MAG: hypothetical protein DCC58_15485 [Chloroflexi bacterium]|nr:MAG: hypothetical protein DCC58_15485 [Chloroflexota bacterium]